MKRVGGTTVYAKILSEWNC